MQVKEEEGLESVSGVVVEGARERRGLPRRDW